MNIVNMNIEDLIEYDNNPRFNDNAVEPVARSIEQFGWKVPIVIDSNNVIITGHTRLKAAKFLGLDEVPCIVADDLDEDQVKAFRLADNKVGELAGWDYEALQIELDSIELDMGDFGFVNIEDIDLSNFFDEPEQEEAAEEEEEEEKPKDYFLTVFCESEEDRETLRIELEDNGYVVK